MLEITKNGKVKIHWAVSPYMYTKEGAEEIKVVFADKYGISKDRIKVVPDFIMQEGSDENKIITSITSDNIQDPKFQKKMFLEYLKVNNITEYDWKTIDAIDNEFNEKIDFFVYEKYRKYSIKWIRWSNFLSYGADNYFDFQSLNGLVLLNSIPANRTGKTAFAVDLLHYLLFGKPGRHKKCEDLFNVKLPEETTLSVEGCINIEGEDYIIKRTLKRPSLSKRTPQSKTSQTVEYYRVIGDSLDNLDDYVEENGEDPRQTNKIIKECIGREEDFDLMMCVTGSNIDELTEQGATERGKLFMRWMGLLSIEDKFNMANEHYNSEIKPNLAFKKYNKEALKIEIESYKKTIEENGVKLKKLESEINGIDSELNNLEKEKNELFTSKRNVDSSVMNVDIVTLNNNIEMKIAEGKRVGQKINELAEEIKNIGEINFSIEEYNALCQKQTEIVSNQKITERNISDTKKVIEQLKSGEYCPTCGQRLKNVDNSKKIEEKKKELELLVEKNDKAKEEIIKLKQEIASRQSDSEKNSRLNTIRVEKSGLEVKIKSMREEYQTLANLKKEYEKNRDSIDKNAKIDVEINKINGIIYTKNKDKERKIYEKANLTTESGKLTDEIGRRNDIIEKITQDEVYDRNYRLYLEMIGKNGISKMVLREALPIINGRISQMLDGVCDFDIEVLINNKNEITFNIIQDGVASDVNSGSGFEKTVTALVLRSVISEISTIPKMNFIIFDEILGRVASENHDKIKLLYDRIVKYYDFVFHITHNESVLDWHNQIVTVVRKENGCSELKEVKNTETKKKNNRIK